MLHYRLTAVRRLQIPHHLYCECVLHRPELEHRVLAIRARRLPSTTVRTTLPILLSDRRSRINLHLYVLFNGLILHEAPLGNGWQHGPLGLRAGQVLGVRGGCVAVLKVLDAEFA